MPETPKYPWRIDTNDRYRELAALVIGLSTGALFVPVFLARNFLGIDEKQPLTSVFSCWAYLAWLLFSLAIFSGLLFHIFSAKWIRLAWEQSASFVGVSLTDKSCETWLEWTLWIAVLSFVLGMGFTLWFLLTVIPAA
jgi:hypothetical protein